MPAYVVRTCVLKHNNVPTKMIYAHGLNKQLIG